MAAGKEWKTILKTRLSLYKYLVMPFGLANASNFFQNFINDVLENNILDLFVIAYVDDILVFSKTLYKQKKHVKTVLACLQAVGLQLDIDKCKFEVHKTKYLGLIIISASSDGRPGRVKMCSIKTSAIDSWEILKVLKMFKAF